MGSRFLATLGLLALMVCGCKNDRGSGREIPEEQPKRPMIAVVSQGTADPFWMSVRAGATKAAAELDAELVWKDPASPRSVEQQTELVRASKGQGVDGIILAPVDAEALQKVVKEAAGSKIPVVLIGSPSSGHAQQSFVGANPLDAGKLAGERMVETLGGKGKVVILRSEKPDASTKLRERGFLDEVKKASGMAVTTETHGGSSTDEALAAAERLLATHDAGDNAVDGIFSPTESATLGVLLALQKAKLVGGVKLVGFGVTTKLLAGVESGHVDAVVRPDSNRMGYMAVAAMVSNLLGEPVEATYDPGSVVVTKQSLDEPRIKALLQP